MKKIVSLFLVLTSSILFANVQVSLDEAIEIGLKNSDEEKISKLNRDIAWQKYEQAVSAMYPHLTLQGGLSQRGNSQTFDFHSQIDLSELIVPLQSALNMPSIPTMINNDTKVKLTGNRIWQSSAIISYPLYAGGKITALKKQASLNTQIESLKAINSTKDLRWRITQAYVQAWWAKSMLKTANDTKDRVDFTYEMTKYLIDNGSVKVNKTDLLRTKSFAATIASMSDEFKIAYGMSVEYLNFVTNSDRKIEPFDEFDEEKIIDYNIDTKNINLVEQNPSFKMANLAVKVFEAKKDEAKSGYLPSILFSLKGTYQRDNYEYGYFNDENEKTIEATLGFEWKVFDGFLTSAKNEEARLGIQKSRIQEGIVKKALSMQISQAKIAFEGKKEQIEDLKEAYSASNENRKLHQRAYKQELVSARDMLESQIYESIAKGSLIGAKKELILQRATLEKLLK